MKSWGIIVLYILASSQCAFADDLEHWVRQQKAVAESRMRLNISTHGTRLGAVVASPSMSEPNYYFHWVRDAALTMDVYMRQLEGARSTLSEDALRGLLWDYFTFSEFGYLLPSYDGVGEPRYNVDGRPNQEPWGRPQNDGPALRASLLMRFGRYLITHNQKDLVLERLWPLIRHDLNYVGQNVYRSSFDLWEEVRAQHFYTRMVGRAALLNGVEFAQKMGEPMQAAWYRSQAQIFEQLLQDHFNSNSMQILENINFEAGHDYKYSGLDVATLLAVLHTRQQPYLKLDNPILIQTLTMLQDQFSRLYEINDVKKWSGVGVAIGRYPEDRYYGGNPWFLSTLAFAEYYYLLGRLEQGDLYMRRVRLHIGADGRMSEQMSRWNGYMLSAQDLTWSYAAFLTACEARENLLKSQKKGNNDSISSQRTN